MTSSARAQISGSVVRTSGDQTYGTTLFLSPVSVGDPRATVLEATTVRTQRDVFGNGNSLVIDGNAVFGDDPDAASSDVGVAGLTVTGASTVNVRRGIHASNDLVFEGPVTLTGNRTLNGGAVKFLSAVVGSGWRLTTNAQAGGLVFGGDVGTAAEPLASIDVFTFQGGDILVNASIYATKITLASNGEVDGGPSHAIHASGEPASVTLRGVAGIGRTNPIAVDAPGGTEAFSGNGGIRLRGLGDLIIYAGGVVAADEIDLDASGDIVVRGGSTIDTDGGVTATKRIRWQVDESSGSEPGSLGDVINNANTAGVRGSLEFVAAASTYTISDPLPNITTDLVINGGGTVTLDGGGKALNGLVYAEGSSGSRLRNLSLRGFRNVGIRLQNAPGVMISEVAVTSINSGSSMGLFATGDLTGTTVESCSFTGGLRGAMLTNARNLAFGAVGRGNTLTGARAVRGSLLSGTGILAQGDLTGTVVAGNTLTGNNYGVAFVNARNLRVENNVVSRSHTAAIVIDGNNRGSSIAGSSFGQGAQRNTRNFWRLCGARGL